MHCVIAIVLLFGYSIDLVTSEATVTTTGESSLFCLCVCVFSTVASPRLSRRWLVIGNFVEVANIDSAGGNGTDQRIEAGGAMAFKVLPPAIVTFEAQVTSESPDWAKNWTSGVFDCVMMNDTNYNRYKAGVQGTDVSLFASRTSRVGLRELYFPVSTTRWIVLDNFGGFGAEPPTNNAWIGVKWTISVAPFPNGTYDCSKTEQCKNWVPICTSLQTNPQCFCQDSANKTSVLGKACVALPTDAPTQAPTEAPSCESRCAQVCGANAVLTCSCAGAVTSTKCNGASQNQSINFALMLALLSLLLAFC